MEARLTMPTREEKLEQIEAALTNRFLGMIPEVYDENSRSWNKEDHRINRLSRALAAYALVGLCKISDESAVDAITDGRDDGGIDALHFHREEGKLFVIQAKYKRGGAAPDQAEMIKTCSGIRALRNRRFGEFNSRFADRMEMIEEALDTPGVRIEAVVVFLGEGLGPHATQEANSLHQEFGGRLTWHTCGCEIVHAWLIAEQVPETINADFPLQNWSCVELPFKAIYGSISARDLAKLVEEKGPDLFERNIRKYLGSQGVNLAIQKTVREQPSHLFYLNNGLTAIAKKITPSLGGNDRCVFHLESVSIVNGAQTAGAVFSTALENEIPEEARLMVTIIEIGDDIDDLGRRITKARNHQNLVRTVDFAALDPNQERVRRELAAVGVKYYYRPSQDSGLFCEDSFTFEQAALSMACLSRPLMARQQIDGIPQDQRRGVGHAVEFVVAAKKEVSVLWDQYGRFYRKLFNNNTSPLFVCRCVRIYRFVDSILADSESSSGNLRRKSFYSHCRLFVMAFVSSRANEIVRRLDSKLTEAEKLTLSRLTNELAELIYSRASTFEGTKGYPAVFKSLTDCQQLADQLLSQVNTGSLQENERTPHEGDRGASS